MGGIRLDTVLIVAPSNHAVDNITQGDGAGFGSFRSKIRKWKPRIVRVGTDSLDSYVNQAPPARPRDF